MGRFAKELPEWCDRFKTESSINIADQAAFHTEVSQLGDRYLVTVFLELPTPYKMSIYADFLEREIISRFCDQHAGIPAMAMTDE